jgi:hypothetical protein
MCTSRTSKALRTPEHACMHIYLTGAPEYSHMHMHARTHSRVHARTHMRVKMRARTPACGRPRARRTSAPRPHALVEEGVQLEEHALDQPSSGRVLLFLSLSLSLSFSLSLLLSLSLIYTQIHARTHARTIPRTSTQAHVPKRMHSGTRQPACWPAPSLVSVATLLQNAKLVGQSALEQIALKYHTFSTADGSFLSHLIPL